MESSRGGETGDQGTAVAAFGTIVEIDHGQVAKLSLRGSLGDTLNPLVRIAPGRDPAASACRWAQDHPGSAIRQTKPWR